MSVHMEFRHLKYISTIAETTNFTRASEVLFVTQPALSRQIKELEDALGFPIFLRNREGLHLTPAGQMVLTFAHEALKTRTETIRAARAVSRGEVQPLRLGFSSFTPSEVLKSFCTEFSNLFPVCEIQLSGNDPVNILHRLEQRNLDAAVLPMPINGSEWIVEQIATHPLVVCMRSDDRLSDETDITPKAISGRLRVFRDPETHPAAHERLMEMLAEVGIQPEISCRAATPPDLFWLVKSGYGLALVDERITLPSELITKPMATVRWTADTAFVHHQNVEHLALPILLRHFRKFKRKKPETIDQRRREDKQLPLELHA
jgi:DNA-binding transcriptional LysR family regulator